MQPVTQYAKSGDVHIAYQAFGNGPIFAAENGPRFGVANSRCSSAGESASTTNVRLRHSQADTFRTESQRMNSFAEQCHREGHDDQR